MIELGKVSKTPVRLFTDDAHSPPGDVKESLLRLSAMESSAAVAAFPDVARKSRKLDMLTAVAFASRGMIFPSVGILGSSCGMSMLRTGLHESDVDAQAVGSFFKSLRRNVPKDRCQKIGSGDLFGVLTQGASFVCGKYGLDRENLERMESGGFIEVMGMDGMKSVKRVMPRTALLAGLYSMGNHGGGNHFIEMQRVDEVVDGRTAKVFGIEEGMIVFMVHSGGGLFELMLGNCYGFFRNRPLLKPAYFSSKAAFHVGSSGSPRELFRRINYFFRRGNGIPADSQIGEDALSSAALSLNYGFANRAKLALSIGALLGDACGRDADVSFVYDAPHISVRKERVDGVELVVHRNDVVKAVPASCLPRDSLFSGTGTPVIKPGMSSTSSYVCAAGEGVRKSLYSVDQGVKNLMERMDEKPVAEEGFTCVYRYGSDRVEKRQHETPVGIGESVRLLGKDGLIRPVARTTPIAVLKA